MDHSIITLTITITAPTEDGRQLLTLQQPVGLDEACHPEASAAALLAQLPTAETLGATIFEAFEEMGIGCYG